MSNQTFDAVKVLNSVHGFLSLGEAEMLFKLASEVPSGGIVVEIGSYQGRSTVCLGLGAKQSGARVYAIDPHEEYLENGATRYGMENHAALLMNLVLNEVADVVRVIALDSANVIEGWDKPVDLLWIDGSHKFEDVRYDLISWEWLLTPNGKIVLHDSNGHFPGVSRALVEFTMNNPWRMDERIDAITVLVRDV